MAVPIGRPGSGGGGGASGFDNASHETHSLMFINNEERRDVPTRFGTAERVAVSEYVVCVTCNKVYKDVMTFGMSLAPMILDGTEAVVLGTLGRGQASAGKSAAWLLFDFTDDEGAAAGEWLNAHAATLPSGRLVIEDVPEPEPEPETF